MRHYIVFVLSVGLLAVLSSADNREDFLNKICNKCEGCKGIAVIGTDTDGDPLFECERSCERCSDPKCQKVPRIPECKFCRTGEAISRCAQRCQRGCVFCSKTKACKNTF